MHRPWQPVSGLHLHLIKSRTALDSSSKSVQFGINLPLTYFQPHSSGGDSTWSAIKDWPHTWSAYYAALSTFFHNAAPVGRILPIALPWQKSSLLHSFVVRALKERLWSSTVNCSWVSMASFTSFKEGWFLSLTKTEVTSSNNSQTFHAQSFVTCERKETWSHPVIAWKNGMALGLSSPIWF